MQVVMTGAGGFLGSNLAPRLAALGATQILVSPHPEPELEALTGAEVRVGRAGDLAEQLDLPNADVLFHFASSTNPRRGTWAEEIAQLGELAALLDAAAAGAVGPRVVFCSSGGTVYADGPDPHHEDERVAPRIPYAWGKVASEELIAAWARRQKISATILRCANIYGPGQVVRRQGLIRQLLDDVRGGTATEVWGDGGEVRDYVYVEDVCDLIERVLGQSERAGGAADGVFNVGTGVGASVNEVIAAVERGVGRAPRITRAPAVPGAIRCNVLDARRAQERLGWSATTSLEDGIGATWAWLETHAGPAPDL